MELRETTRIFENAALKLRETSGIFEKLRETSRNSENIKATVRPLCRIASVDHQIDVLSNFPVPKGRVAFLRAALPAPPAWARTSAGRISPDQTTKPAG